MRGFFRWVCILLFLGSSYNLCGNDSVHALISDSALNNQNTFTINTVVNNSSQIAEQAKIFITDAKLPDDILDEFLSAIKGDLKAQEALQMSLMSSDHSYSVLLDVLTAKTDYTAASEETCYNAIARLYYDGNEKYLIKQDKVKAFIWLKLASSKGSFEAAIFVGDMLRNGDGIQLDEKMAFESYQLALKNKCDGVAYERIAYCYKNGIGTIKNSQKSDYYYLMSALDGNRNSLYELSTTKTMTKVQTLLYSKAFSCLDYNVGLYKKNAMLYVPSNEKIRVVNTLYDTWNNGSDPLTRNMYKTLKNNLYYSTDFIDLLAKTSYTYSYHILAEKYGVAANRTYKDAKKINDRIVSSSDYWISESKRYLEYEGCEFYELDFDLDGVNEIAIPINRINSDTSTDDEIVIFKINSKGKYLKYTLGPSCDRRDSIRLIQYKGRYYFIANPYSKMKDKIHDITALTIGKDLKVHELKVSCEKYKLKEINAIAYGKYNQIEYKDFLKSIMQQADEAVKITKKSRLYNTNKYNILNFPEGPQDGAYSEDSDTQDIFFLSDIDNDSHPEYIRKSHIILNDKEFSDLNLIEVYQNDVEFKKNTKPILDAFILGESNGGNSRGNIYDIFPLSGEVVQFWTTTWKGKTYCVSLSKKSLLYALRVYLLEGNKITPVYDGLLFDEVQNIKISTP